MTRQPENGWHPDADTLSAFAEHALPPAERAPLVAHLAGCARCRDVVFLAGAAMEDPVSARPAAVGGANPHRGRWWTRVRPWAVVVPAGALAAGAALVFWVERPEPGSTGSEVARSSEVARQSANQPEISAMATERGAAPATGSKEAEPASPRIEAKTKTPHRHREDTVRAIPEAPATSFATEEQLTQWQHAVIAPEPAGKQNLPSPTDMQPLAGTAFPASGSLQSGSLQSGSLRAGPPQSNVGPVGAGLNRGAMSGVRYPDAQPQAGGPLVLATEPAAARKYGAPPLPRLVLPDGKAPVSTAAVFDRVVALDAEGALYRSTDAGKQWHTVRPAWTGKALRVTSRALSPHWAAAAGADGSSLVRLREEPVRTQRGDEQDAAATPGRQEPAGPVDPARATTPEPSGQEPDQPDPLRPAGQTDRAGVTAGRLGIPALFRLVTDRHETWVSADGVRWQRQQP